jgi:hypothetical protein
MKVSLMNSVVLRLVVGTLNKTGEEAEAREAEQGARRVVEEEVEEVVVQATSQKMDAHAYYPLP